MSNQAQPNQPRSLLSQILRIYGVVVVIILVTVAIIAGIGWWAGWQTEGKFKMAIQIAGLILIGVGFLGIKGNREMPRGNEDQHNSSVAKGNSWKRTQQSLQNAAQSYSFLLIMFSAGGLCMIIGMLM